MHVSVVVGLKLGCIIQVSSGIICIIRPMPGVLLYVVYWYHSPFVTNAAIEPPTLGLAIFLIFLSRCLPCQDVASNLGNDR